MKPAIARRTKIAVCVSGHRPLTATNTEVAEDHEPADEPDDAVVGRRGTPSPTTDSRGPGSCATPPSAPGEACGVCLVRRRAARRRRTPSGTRITAASATVFATMAMSTMIRSGSSAGTLACRRLQREMTGQSPGRRLRFPQFRPCGWRGPIPNAALTG